MPKKTRLEYTDEKSNKFWEIEVSGNSHTVRFGKAGTEGQSKTKEFPSEEAAQKDADKQIGGKLKKGYLEKKTGTGSKSPQKSGKTGQGTGYSGILNAKDKKELQRALCEHFSSLADTPGAEKILEMVMGTASSAKLEDGKLVVHLKDKALTASPPDKKAKYGSYGYLFEKHARLECASLDLGFITADRYFDDLEEDELEDELGDYYDELKDISLKKLNILVRENSDIWMPHPKKKNPLGKPQLIGILHDEGSDASPYNPGGFFLLKMAGYLKLKVSLPDAPQEKKAAPHSSQTLSFSSAEFLKETVETADNLKNDLPESGIQIFLTREDNNTAYMYNDEEEKLFIYEIKNNRLMKASEIALKMEMGSSSSILDGDYIYISGFSGGISGGNASILDISDYKNPKHIPVKEQSVNTLCVRKGIIYSNRYKYNEEYNEKNNSYLTPGDIEMPEIPKGKNLIRHWNEEESPGNLRCRENPVYLADGIYVRELTGKEAVRKTLKFGQNCLLITIDDTLVGFTDDDTVAFDISDPLEPTIVNSKKKENYPVQPIVFPGKKCIVLLERNFAISVTTVDRKITGIQKLLKNFKTVLWDRLGDIIWLLLEGKKSFSLAAVQIDAVESRVIVEPMKLKPEKDIPLYKWRWMKVDGNRAHFFLHGETDEYISFHLK